MTRKETLQVLTVLAASYPDTFKAESAEVKRARVDLWETSFLDIPVELVKQVVQAHIISDSGEFFPRVATLRRKCVEAMTEEHERPMAETEAWALVRRALGNSYYGASEEFDKLPRLVRKAVGAPSVLKDWGQMSPDSLSVEQSHFLRNYRALVEREAQERIVPPQLSEGIKRAGMLARGESGFTAIGDAAKALIGAGTDDAEQGAEYRYMDL